MSGTNRAWMDDPAWLRALDEQLDEGVGVELANVPRQRLGRDDVHRFPNEELARLRCGQNLGQDRPHLEHSGEALEDGDEAPMLALRRLRFDDVVVEVIRPIAWGYGEQLRPRRMHENGAHSSDFRRHVGGHSPKLTVAV